MNIPLILAIAFLMAMLANLVDWAVTHRGPFWWLPSGRVWVGCLAAIGVTSVGVLLRLIPPSAMPLIAVPPIIFQQLGSIWMRHASPEPVA